uniref:Uncharacterized protein n=1 Tax=Panagrolaimus sp. ES5 TaxID=591445 RepID=A0AC34GNW4_9BILA
MSTIASIIFQSATTTEAPPEFLGVSITAWIIMLCVVCGVILIALLLLACCCLCCPVSSEEEEKAKKSAETASTQKRTAAPFVPVASKLFFLLFLSNIFNCTSAFTFSIENIQDNAVTYFIGWTTIT